jgi:hypothetical protein
MRGALVMMLLLPHFAAEDRVAINDIGQYHRQDNHCPPECEAQGFMLSRSLLEGYAWWKDVRIKGSDKPKVSCEKQEDTTSER